MILSKNCAANFDILTPALIPTNISKTKGFVTIELLIPFVVTLVLAAGFLVWQKQKALQKNSADVLPGVAINPSPPGQDSLATGLGRSSTQSPTAASVPGQDDPA